MTQQDANNTCSLNYRGLNIRTRSDSPQLLVWLAEFVQPWFDDDEPVRAAVDLNIMVDADQYRARRSESADMGTIACFTLDDDYERSRLLDRGERRVADLGRRGAVLTVDTMRPEVELLIASDGAQVRVALMRVVRELATQWSLSRGDLFLHAAGVDFAGQAVLISGQKRAGKTSTLISGLSQPGARYLTNDRAFVTAERDGSHVRGMPTIVKVRPDSLNYLPDVAAPDWGCPHRHYLTLDECRRRSPLLEPARHDPPSMSPAQLCDWLKVDRVAQSRLSALVLPRIDPQVSSFALDLLPDDHVMSRAGDCLFPVAPADSQPGMFEGLAWLGKKSSRDAARSLAQVLRSVPAYTARLGPGAFNRPGVWDAILDRIRSR